MGLRDRLVCRVRKGLMGQLVRRDRRVQREHKERLGQQGRRVRRDRLELRV